MNFITDHSGGGEFLWVFLLIALILIYCVRFLFKKIGIVKGENWIDKNISTIVVVTLFLLGYAVLVFLLVLLINS